MKNGSPRRTALKRILIAAAITLLTAAIAIGVSYARYRVRFSAASQLELQYGFTADSIYLLAEGQDENGEYTGAPVAEDGAEIYSAPGDWTMLSNEKDIYQMRMLLSNEKIIGSPSQYDQTGRIEVFVSAGATDQNELIIQLKTDSGTFLASGSEVEEGSSLYQAYGPGSVYRFVNSSGEPITWRLAGGVSTAIPIEITVWGTFDYPGAITVVATGVPS